MYKPYGVIPPIITPFDENGGVDYAALAKMAVHLVDNGVHGLFPLGTTGEFYAINDEQFIKILETVRDAVAGKTNRYGKPIQLIAGCSHITTREVCRLIKLVEQVGGYDAVSVLTPMFVSQTQDELYNYYKTIADSTAMPVIMYNNKPKTNVTIEPATVAKLAEIPNIIGVKDSTGDMTNTEEYLRLTRGMDFNVMMGRDTLIYAALCYGAKGAIASCANVAPRVAVDIYEKFKAGDHAGALEAQFKFSALRISTNMGTFPVVLKEALKLIGHDCGDCVEPIQPLNDAQREKLRGVLTGMGLL